MKLLPLTAVILVATLMPSRAQTATATTSTSAPAPSASTDQPHAAGQIGPGTTGTISPAQGVTPTTANKAGQILKNALTPKTRQTLQDAMDNVTPPVADASAPGGTNAPSASAPAPSGTNATTGTNH